MLRCNFSRLASALSLSSRAIPDRNGSGNVATNENGVEYGRLAGRWPPDLLLLPLLEKHLFLLLRQSLEVPSDSAESESTLDLCFIAFS